MQEDPNPDPDRSPRPTASIRIDCGGAAAAATAAAGRINKPLNTGRIGSVCSSKRLCGNSIGFHSLDRTDRTDRQDRLDLQELLVVAVDSVAPEASIQQAGSLIRIAGNRCIGMFPCISVEFF